MESSLNEIVCPFENEWKFHKSDLMDLKDSENGCLKGKHFYAYNIPGLQYFIAIYPNGYAEEDRRGETWAFLCINGSNERKISAEFTLSVESANYSKNLNYVFEDIIGWGKEKICKIDEFFDPKNNFFVNGEITIKVKGIFKSQRLLISIIFTPISMQWKIKEENLRKSIKKESNSASLCSKSMNAPSFSDVKYYLSICPNEINDKNQSETFLYLFVQTGKEKEIGIVFDFSIDSANFNCDLQYVFEKNEGWGPRLCSMKDLFDPTKKYIVDGYLTINLNGIMMAEKNQLFESNSKNNIQPKFNLKILASKSVIDAKDFKILIEEKEARVHKKLLMNVSSVLKGMFESGMKESIENKMIILYGTNVIKEFSLEEMLLLYRFGDKYEIKHIMDWVEGYLIKEMSPSNVVQLIKFSSPDALNVKKLYQKCIDFFIKCSKESTPISGSESLDEKLLASIFLKTLRPVVDTL
uniref:BTB domain-containing protein n=1 Tax=Panagrolaimus davidi TaxID=227884 RepID=A0A914QS82_9BILA